MVGRNPGCVTTQGEIVFDLLRAAGFPVISVSDKANRYRRLLDIAASLTRLRKQIAVQCLQVYGGPSFVVEDIASRLGRLFGHRIVMHLHGGALPAFMARFPRWTRRVFRRADAFVTPSKFLARALAGHGFEAQIIPNVVDVSGYTYRHRTEVRPRLFWMRSFHPIYNPMMAMRVLHRVRAFAPDASLVMAGQEKGSQAQVRREALTLGLDGALRLPGFLDLPGKLREGNAADIYLNTNRVDNTPVAVLEAGALGLPVVSTNVGGMPDLLTQDETGLLVPDDDDAAMASAIRRLLDTPSLAARLSANGRRLSESCSWDHVRPQWQELFSKLLGGAARNVNGTSLCAV
jgi:glycosyltransferase involved in cell wall biosynthesis